MKILPQFIASIYPPLDVISKIDHKKRQFELLKTLAEAEVDVANSKIAPIQTTFDAIRETLLRRRHER